MPTTKKAAKSATKSKKAKKAAPKRVSKKLGKTYGRKAQTAPDVSHLPQPLRSICEKFYQTREQTQLSQQQFGDSIGVSRVYVNAAERGHFQPSHTVIKTWAEVYKLSIDWIYGLKDN